MKNKLKKHIRKYIAVACSLLLIPIFSVNAFADTLIIDETESYSFTARSYFGFYSGPYMNDVGIATGSGSRIYNKSDVTATSDSYYSLDNNQLKNVSYLNVTFRAGESYPIISDLYDYFLYFYWSFDDVCTFNPDKFIVTYNDGTTNILHSFEPFTVLPYNMDGRSGFGCYAKVDFSEDMAINSICVGDSRMNATVGASAHFWALIIPIEKGSSQEQINNVVSAINHQTEIIENGNSDTQSVVSDFNEVFEDFNNELENIEDFDNQIIGEFESANEQYLTELNNFSLSASLLNAGNWLSTSMQTVYDNSSDYKMLWLVPLLLGIPLIILFLKRSDDNE